MCLLANDMGHIDPDPPLPSECTRPGYGRAVVLLSLLLTEKGNSALDVCWATALSTEANKRGAGSV